MFLIKSICEGQEIRFRSLKDGQYRWPILDFRHKNSETNPPVRRRFGRVNSSWKGTFISPSIIGLVYMATKHLVFIG